jgi:hypothetical protein
LFTRSLAIAVILTLCPVVTHADPATPLPPPLTIQDVDLIPDISVWIEVTLPRIEGLAQRLEGVGPEGMNADELAEARLSYMEYQLLATRLALFERPSDEELKSQSVNFNRIDAAEARCLKQLKRLAGSSRVNKDTGAFALSLIRRAPQPTNNPMAGVTIQTQILRAQLELYALQHKEPADLQKMGWKQLLSRTDANGNIDENGKFGPYFQSAPANPLNKSKRVIFIEGKPAKDFTYTEKPAGWVMDVKSQRIWPLDESGRIILENSVADVRE